MRKRLWYLVLGMCFFTSCTKEVVIAEDSINMEKDEIMFTSEEYDVAKNQIKEVIVAVLNRAYDGESIDIEEFEKIASSKTGLTKEELISIEDKHFTRSSSNVGLSSKQEIVVNEMTEHFREKKTIDNSDLAYAMSICSNLSSIEQQEIVEGVLITKMTIESLEEIDGIDGIDGQMLNRAFAEKFLCSLACEGIGGVWGIMGRGILVAAGIGTGGLASAGVWVVTSVAGTMLAAVACP